MKKYTIILLAGALAVWGTAMTIHHAHADWDNVSMNKQVDDTSFVVNQNCSGTKIGPELVLTANHCIADMFEDVERDVISNNGEVEKKKFRIALPGYVSQKFFDGVHETRTYSYRYKIKARSVKFDLAILKTDAPLPASEETPISCKEPGRGDTVYAVGNPFVVLYATVTKGTVSSVQRNYEQIGISNGEGTYGQDNGFFQFTAAIAPGNSGGAVYNDSGELVGVVVRGGPSNIGLGVPLADVRSFLKDNDAFIAYGVKKVCD
jgi:hypothetical protein